MRNKKQIIIDIDVKGNCSIEGEGFVGPECAYFMEEIEQELGTKISETNKPAYHQRNVNRDRDRQIGGR